MGGPGREHVAKVLGGGAAISPVNIAEVLSKAAERGMQPSLALSHLDELQGGLELFQLERIDLIAIAELREPTRQLGLSLGDRACLALGRRLGLPILTADRAWAELDLPGVEVRLIR